MRIAVVQFVVAKQSGGKANWVAHPEKEGYQSPISAAAESLRPGDD
jgi:hypothetical protein